MKVLLAITVLAIAFAVSVAEPTKKTINIRPGVDEEHTVTNAEGITCKFSYVCTGGSSEEWHIELEQREDEWHCTITRGSPSYLFFKSFKASFDGKAIADVDVLGQEYVLRRDKEYIVQLNEVKSTGSYEGIINVIGISHKIDLYKDEL
eukprot:TRINITY_DN13726_c0_g1_i1.p1 TRINITY_DN13726_c0_g1~~TRINITY_DN13726_c0_g1_i1.p1  ORF type:complete len:149 (-),score=36.02 TRINITY_DN13726_c0_g1_i1:101-547(-)